MVAKVSVLLQGYIDEHAEHVASTVSLVEDNTTKLIVDPGMVKHKHAIRDALEKEHLSVDQITHVFITHHHPDHTINVGMFPKAKVIDYDSIYDHDVWLTHDGNFHITSNIHVIPTPGHTMEDATLLVNTEKGVIAFTHAWWHEDLTPEVDPLAEDSKLLRESRDRILSEADYVITSHGGMSTLKKV